MTPLTTYTFSTDSQQSETVSASDDNRLPPGGFSLRHGFPAWFTDDQNITAPIESGSPRSSLDQNDHLRLARLTSVQHGAENHKQAANEHPLAPTRIWDILCYMKSTFDDEMVLDSLPIMEAANDRAWKAWQAHQRSIHNLSGPPSKDNESDASPEHRQIARVPDDWNWDGVWQDRVREGINASISKPTLFGAGGDDPVSCSVGCKIPLLT